LVSSYWSAAAKEIAFKLNLCSYGFSRIKWPGRELFFYPVIASIFIFVHFPVNPITMVPLFSLFAQLGLVNTYLPLVLPTFFGNPFFIFLLRQFMLQIPTDLSEWRAACSMTSHHSARLCVVPPQSAISETQLT
jgi:ABC-type glycerol-3-phosphate transport system permease component